MKEMEEEDELFTYFYSAKEKPSHFLFLFISSICLPFLRPLSTLLSLCSWLLLCLILYISRSGTLVQPWRLRSSAILVFVSSMPWFLVSFTSDLDFSSPPSPTLFFFFLVDHTHTQQSLDLQNVTKKKISIRTTTNATSVSYGECLSSWKFPFELFQIRINQTHDTTY